MARYRHYQNRGGPGACIFATTTCLDFAHLLSRPEMKDRMVRILVRAHMRYGARLHAYTVMSNHLHLVSRMPEDMTSSIFMQRLKDKATNTLLPLLTDQERMLMSAQVGLDRRQFWKRSFDSVVLESPQVFHQKVRYTHLNPVRAGLVEDARDYQWCSVAAYEKGLWTPSEGLCLKELLED